MVSKTFREKETKRDVAPVESRILMMKSIDGLIDLIHIIEVKCVGLTTIA